MLLSRSQKYRKLRLPPTAIFLDEQLDIIATNLLNKKKMSISARVQLSCQGNEDVSKLPKVTGGSACCHTQLDILEHRQEESIISSSTIVDSR